MSKPSGQLTLFDLDIWSGKTSPEHSVQENPAVKTSASFSRKPQELRTAAYLYLDLRPGYGNLLGPYWEINSPSLGVYWTLNTGPAPLNADGVSSLSQILVAVVPLKYYLSKTACLGILRRAKTRGKELPPQLEMALKIQAGIYKLDKLLIEESKSKAAGFDGYNGDLTGDKSATLGVNCGMSTGRNGVIDTENLTAFAFNQRDEVRDLNDVSGALQAQPGMKQQTFIAVPVNTQTVTRHKSMGKGTGFGIGKDGDPAYTLQEAHSHGVFISDNNCLNPWDTQQSRVFTSDGVSPALTGADGGGGRNPAGLLFSAGVITKGNGECILTPEKHTSLSAGGGQAGQGYPCVLTAGFCAGAAPSAGGIGYQEECAPTLKGSSGGNMVPSVICLNDQGGDRMDVYENMTGTLRSQMDGHPPLILEPQQKDTATHAICLNDQGGNQMYCSNNVTGTLRAQEHGHQPLVMATQQSGAEIGVDVCPTITSAAGTSGNNHPVLFENHGIDSRYSKAQIDAFKARYTIGSRIELNYLCNDEPGMPKGLRGTIVAVDSQPALLMEWDNGRTLSLLPEDRFRKLTSYEVEREKHASLIKVCDQNIWLKNYGEYPAHDYPYSFKEINKLDELSEIMKHGNWSIRTGIIFGGNLAFVQQVNGGDEWLALKQEDGKWQSFDSISLEHILRHSGTDRFHEYICDLVDDKFRAGINEEGIGDDAVRNAYVPDDDESEEFGGMSL